MRPSPETTIPAVRVVRGEDPMATIVGLLQERRYEIGLTQLDLEHAAGLSDGHIAKIQAGYRQPRGYTLALLMGALGVDLEVRLVVHDGERVSDPLRCRCASRRA